MYRKYSGQDRRRYQRLELNITLLYRVNEPIVVRMQVGDKEIEATMINLSEGGMGFLTDYNIPLGTELFIKFTLSKMDKEGHITFHGPMQIIAEVRSNIAQEKNEYRLGVCFTKIKMQDKGGITDFVKTALSL
ncbi:MAG: PilZ domain-containing protein [Candidatus Omnitrophota bacterium]